MMNYYITRDELETLLRNGKVRLNNGYEWIEIDLNSRFNVVDMLNRLRLGGE